MKEIIKVLTTKAYSSESYFKEEEGQLYKGFGIVKWLSAGKKRPFVIHIETGKIISELTGGTLMEVKKRINISEKFINPNMEYKQIESILEEKRSQLV